MKLDWKRASILISALIAAGLLFLWSGLLDVRASTGHWRITDLFLHWVMRSSVRTAALGTDPPPFTPGMLPLAAGHYEIGCAGCHGSPAIPRPSAAVNMLPPPPDLKDVEANWTDGELFEIVRHGVRYTGMPAWPAQQREDEVWAMVAFIRQYPRLSGPAYMDLAGFAATQSSNFGQIVETCKGCHSPDRLDHDSLIPRLEGQSEIYLRDSLQAFADGKRLSGTMKAALSQISPEDRLRLAAHFAEGDTRTPPLTQNSDAGRAISDDSDRRRKIPTCVACHDTNNANAAYPRLAGQPSAYLESQLRLFREGNRGGGPYRDLMSKAAANLSDDDIRALASYYGSLPRN